MENDEKEHGRRRHLRVPVFNPASQQLATLIAGFQSPGLKGSGSCHGCCLAMGTVPGGTVLSRQAEMLNLFRKRWFSEQIKVEHFVFVKATYEC